MVAGLMTSVIDAIMNGPEGGDAASLTLAGVDPRDYTKIYKGFGFDFSERALQYWPETLSDTIEVGWDFKSLGGASHALAQWGSNGGRTISFDIQLSRFMMPVKSRTLQEKIFAYLTRPDSENPVDQRPFNVNIAEQIAFLRGFCYPTYTDIEGVVSSLPPPIMILNIPKFGLNEGGGDTIYCVMTGCDVTYALAFRDGTPRRASVSVTLRQIVQTAKGIKMRGFGEDSPYKYNMEYPQVREPLNPNAGRPKNGIDPGWSY